MLTPEQFSGFLLAAMAITVAPGPDNLMVLGIGIAKGRWHGVAFGLGCALGCLTHTALAVLGVSTLIAASPTAFAVLKIVGGLYLLWLGVQALRSTARVRVDGKVAGDPSLAGLFWRGMLANAINPKVGLFFISFLPQFVIAGNGSVDMQMAALGLTFTAQSVLIFGLLGFFAGTIGQWINRRPSAGRWLDRFAGAIFVGLGIRLVVST